jgi:hypothetical protein
LNAAFRVRSNELRQLLATLPELSLAKVLTVQMQYMELPIYGRFRQK